MRSNDPTPADGPPQWQALAAFDSIREMAAEAAARIPGASGLELGRREVLKVLGATLALAGLDGCERQPDEMALPFVNDPQGGPGAVRHYATAVELDGIGQPVIGTCRDGRPTKLEGNAAHPASGGATDAFTQAALLGLYDPGRSKAPQRHGAPATWGEAEGFFFDLAATLDRSTGQGFHLLTGPVASPTLLRQIADLRARWPNLRWHVHGPLAGVAPEPVLPLDQTEVLVVLDADPLGPGPLQTIHAKRWADRRRAYQSGQGDAQLFVAEPAPTLTGITAGERLIARNHRIASLLVGLADWLSGASDGPPLTPDERHWTETAARQLAAHTGRGLVVLGAHHPAALHAQVAAINAKLSSPPATPHGAAISSAEQLEALIAAMAAGTARAVLILDSNPVYSTAPESGFAAAFGKVPLRIHAGLHVDETAQACHWHVPLAHLLESWSDVLAADGSAAIVQPLVRPFDEVRSRHELLALIAGSRGDGRKIVQQTWSIKDDDPRWPTWLLSGHVDQESPPPSGPPLAGSAPPQPDAPSPRPGSAGLDLVIRADPSTYDGQFSGNPWLQELPRPLTKLTWDNAIEIGPALAERLGLRNEDMAELSIGGQSIVGPVWVLPGIAPETVLVHLGYGRRAGSEVGLGVGFDAYRLRGAGEPWRRSGASLRKRAGQHPLASTQQHTTMAGHEFVRYVEAADDGLPPPPPRPSMYSPQPRTDGLAWGMAIDLDLCIGCNACVTACVAENNIAMVGKEQVRQGREMHWLRVDRYYAGSPEAPAHVFQPVPCMHCEDAPCEMGCPVNATDHSPDGLNLQVYNRCIGTRTCSAYCPYKVRRFNWLDYTRDDPPELRAARNPEVTVRDRGVMEKCTYCIQRIEREKTDADADGRAMGEVRTACQQACPTQAIVFGNIADPASKVSLRKADRRNFALLDDANTRPRTTYGARIRKGHKA